jgi:(p)ppGpp synthase/HD superfamily hydrolase
MISLDNKSNKFSKLYIALKFRLIGLHYYNALRALELAKAIHDGLRKDGNTPEFQHQIEIALYIFTLKNVTNLEGAIICALLHDTEEDYPLKITDSDLRKFGHEEYASIKKLNKHAASSIEEYFSVLALDKNGSLVKGIDRINNVQSMSRGKFTIEKQKKYLLEVSNYFLPMLKKARKSFPEQVDAYYNIENMLKSQSELIQLFIDASEKTHDKSLN